MTNGALMAYYNYYGDHCITTYEPGWFAEVELRYRCCINGIVTMHMMRSVGEFSYNTLPKGHVSFDLASARIASPT